jgi:hypothetical protein
MIALAESKISIHRAVALENNKSFLISSSSPRCPRNIPVVEVSPVREPSIVESFGPRHLLGKPSS